MPVEEITPGMTGYGLTVIRGTKPERFDVEVIDVVLGVAPGRNAILVRASGLGLEHSGAVAGMSGSPIYIDGRLIGALSFGWPWPKDPIAGVTPIAEMEAALLEPLPRSQPTASWAGFDLSELLSPERPLGSLFKPADSRQSLSETLRPLAVPLLLPALGPQARRIAESLLPGGNYFLAEGISGSAAGAAGAEAASFEPGSPLFATLVSGDMTIGAIGTVTDVRGELVYGFGHSFLGSDDVAIPMYTARISVIFPSVYRSFKLASPMAEKGAITRDRSTGVLGVIGKTPSTVPMRVSINRAGEKATFSYNVFKHYSMTAQLAATVAAESLTTYGGLSPDSTVSYRFKVAYSGGRRLDYAWEAAGANALSSMANDLSGALAVTMFNPFLRLDPQSIDIDFDVAGSDRSAVIDSVTVRENEVRPGGEIVAVVKLKAALSKTRTVTVRLAVPSNILPGQKSLIVCDGRTSDAIDIQQSRRLLNPSDIDQLLDVITPKRSPGEIVLRLADADRGVAISTSEFPRLPSSAIAILAAPEQGQLSALYYSVSAGEVTPFVVSGKSVIPINIKSPQE